MATKYSIGKSATRSPIGKALEIEFHPTLESINVIPAESEMTIQGVRVMQGELLVYETHTENGEKKITFYALSHAPYPVHIYAAAATKRGPRQPKTVVTPVKK